MEEFAKLLDELLLNVAAYPTTIWHLVVSPTHVFRPEQTAQVTSPAVTYLFSGFLTYVALSAVGGKLSVIPATVREKLRDPATWVTVLAVYIAVVANAQRATMALLVDLSSVTLSDQLQLFVYTICPAVAVGAAHLVLMALWPRNLAVAFLGFATAAIYIWSLWQGCRIMLGLSHGKAAIVTIACYLTLTVLVSLAWVAFIWISRRIKNTPLPA